MRLRDLMFSGARVDSVVADVGVLGLRVFTGLSLAIAHGWSKVPPGPDFIRTVTAIGFPAEAAYLTMLAEFGGGLALAAGLLTRPVALTLVINFAVAGFLSHAGDTYRRTELTFLFLAVSFLFLCLGAGRFSLDRLLRRR